MVLLDPAAGAELAEHCLVELAPCAALHPFDASLAEPELRFLESSPDPFGLARGPLGLNEQREALVECHGLGFSLALLLIPSSGHRQQAKSLESFESWFLEHLISFNGSSRAHEHSRG